MTAAESTHLIERLAETVGPEHVGLDPILEIEGLRPRLEAAPASLEEAARVLQAARESGAAVTPHGGGTQQRGGTAPERLDVLLRTERFREIVEWEPADLTACLQAGITLQSLEDRLAERGQQLPIDAPEAATATLGGLVATNTSGPRRWLHGSWRDLIIGMEVALTDGTVIKSGGRVVKNVQGYDLGKLFTGSLGTLCLIGQINVKLLPLPAVRRLLVGRGSLRDVFAFLSAVASSTLRVATVDLLDPEASAVCGVGDDGFTGLVLIEDRQKIVDAQSLAVTHLAEDHGLQPAFIDGTSLEPIWRAWLDLGRTSDLGANEALLSLSALPSEVCAVMEMIERLRNQFALIGRAWARAGNGLVYARLAATEGDVAGSLAAAQASLLERWLTTTLTAGDPAVERGAKPWGSDPAGLSVMRALKQRFDPTRTLQPGRFVGGI